MLKDKIIVATQWLVLLISCSSAIEARAELKICSQAEAITAEESASLIRTARDLFQAYKQYSHCDDGGIAEGYSESVARLLEDHWDRLSDLYNYTKSDKAFEAFVIRHVDATISLKDSRSIYANARSNCPAYAHRLCSRIENTLSKWPLITAPNFKPTIIP